MSNDQIFEYAGNWKRTCKNALKILPRCTCNPLHKASVVHHLKYRRSLLRRVLGLFLLHAPKKSVSGLEIIGWDCIPVCTNCHQNVYGSSFNPCSVHYIKKWKQEKVALNNHNVWWFALELRIKFWLWTLVYSIFKLFFHAIVIVLKLITNV